MEWNDDEDSDDNDSNRNNNNEGKQDDSDGQVNVATWIHSSIPLNL